MRFLGFEFRKIKHKKHNEESELYKNELESIYKAHNFFVGSISALFTVIGVMFIVGGILFYANLNEFKEQSKKAIDDIKNRTTNDIKKLTTNATTQIDYYVNSIKSVVSEKVDSQFNSDNISELVTNRSIYIVDNQTPEIIKERVDKRLQPKIDKMDLEMYFIKAQADNKKSFLFLNELATNKDYIYKDEASQYYQKLLTEFSTPIRYWLVVGPDEKYANDTLSLSDYKSLLLQTDRESKIGLMNDLWGDQQINKTDKLNLYTLLIETDESIKVCRYAAWILVNNFGLNCNFMDWDNVIAQAKKWKSNK